MTIRIISSTTTGIDADANGDLWLIRDGYLLSNAGDAFDFGTFAAVELVVEGAVYSQTDAVDSDAGSSSNTVRVMSTGVVYGSSDGIEMSGDNHTVINSGEVTGLTDRGIQMIGNNAQVTNSGLVYGQSDGISLEGDASYLINTGTVSSEFDGINVSGTGNQVVNTGSVSGARNGVEFNTAAGGANSLINSGTILSTEVGGNGVLGDFGDETVINRGQIFGDVDLGDGNDLFDNRGGSLTGMVAGGLGDDTYITDDAALQIVENAGEGIDEVQSTVNYALGDNLEALTLLGTGELNGRGNAADNTLTGNAGDNVLTGLEGADTIFGGAGVDVLRGGEGDDSLRGELNDDWLTGEAGNDRLIGGNGNDTLLGGAGEDSLYGQAGNDSMLGGDQSDYLSGFGGDDTLSGGGGFDTVIGGQGNDLLTGDFNADRFVFSDGYGADTITDFEATNDAEKIDLSGLTAVTDYADLMANHAAQVGSNVVIDAGGGNVLTLLNVSLGDLDAVDFIF